jgi:hypothetical protein
VLKKHVSARGDTSVPLPHVLVKWSSIQTRRRRSPCAPRRGRARRWAGTRGRAARWGPARGVVGDGGQARARGHQRPDRVRAEVVDGQRGPRPGAGAGGEENSDEDQGSGHGLLQSLTEVLAIADRVVRREFVMTMTKTSDGFAWLL